MKDFGVQPFLFPMPTYMICTYNEDDSVDAMAMAWGGICAENMVALNLEDDHKTVANLKARGAFTLSVPGADTLVESDFMGLVSGGKFPGKFERTGLHAVKSERVDAPVICEYPLTLECKVLEMQQQPYGLRVLGEIVNVMADEKILDESITAIRNEADHMNHLVEQLLFLARGDSGRTSVTMEQLDLSSMMQEVYEESFMIDESHPYRYRPATQAVVVSADPALLKQAVRILIDNAAKYTNPGDEILLECGTVLSERPAPPAAGSGSAKRLGKSKAQTEEAPVQVKEAYIQVQDTGIGMEEADIQQMFERFYRSDEVRSYQGTGLGLSIAKWIIDKHGGHFEVLSRTGLGTRIRILLPA